MNGTPLYKALEKYINSDMSRLHMPGHKGKSIYPFGEALRFDVTEVRGTDSLYAPSEAILETEKLFAAAYGAKRTILSAGGSTLCIQTMLALAAKPKDKIIAGRNIHTAAVNAMALLDLEPVWIYSDNSAGENLAGRITPRAVEAALAETADAAAVYITSPDYFGVLSDIKGIAEVCKKYAVPLLVDNAHGAALKFLETSLHPMDLGADMCCDSLHKTLPVLTGGAVLHIAREKFIEDAKNKMSIFGSTSPNYLIMLSCDMVLEYIEGSLAKDLKRLKSAAAQIEAKALQKGFALPKGQRDETRLVLGFGQIGYTREDFDKLCTKHMLEYEYMSQSHAVFLPSAFNSLEDFERLGDLVDAAVPKEKITYINNFARPVCKAGLREALLGRRELIPAAKSVGRISAEVKITCPPGVPIIMPGEVITPEIKNNLESCGIFSVNVLQ